MKCKSMQWNGRKVGNIIIGFIIRIVQLRPATAIWLESLLRAKALACPSWQILKEIVPFAVSSNIDGNWKSKQNFLNYPDLLWMNGRHNFFRYREEIHSLRCRTCKWYEKDMKLKYTIQIIIEWKPCWWWMQILLKFYKIISGKPNNFT